MSDASLNQDCICFEIAKKSAADFRDLGAYEYTSGSSIVELIQMDIAVYPNPASDYIIIKGIEAGENIQMYNLNGQLVLSHKVEKNEDEKIKIDFLPAGIYLIKTSTGKMIKWIKK